ncbi:gamma-glutamyltransferase [Luteolibacter pohnpeiensis]|uniref:Glutathione hydrolase proenzyme n=1 Tax=Luteolibacter pohnpeiensis TaxID=454153 RepID=A0A934VVK2_9BACT|nr:gamma-glutamyltransferase [Luteolibacter pohnpeiensis]MBK1882275.1 gamma-glutamyltransferase [Luteolibacter pohnpeiensis]
MPIRISNAFGATLASLWLLAGSSHAQVDRLTGKPFATRSEIVASGGMVATSQPLATQVGLKILQDGGSAMDAAIAANAALGLMEPVSCGIGGDLFAIVWDAETQKLYGLNGSGRSPMGLSFDALKQELAAQNLEALPPYGMLSISVPGAVDGWFTLHEKFGKLPMEEVLAPAIYYAKDGFPVSELIAYYWDKSVPVLQDQPGAFRETFTLNGHAPRSGEIFRNPDLARTYERIAQGGAEVFYRGEIADEIDAFFQANGGYLRRADFAAHHSEWVDPVSVNYRGYDVFELPPNGQGMAALQMLKILERHELAALGYNTPEFLHLMIEAKKLVYEDRAKFYADPDFTAAPIDFLLSDEYAAQRDALIDPLRAAKRIDAGKPLRSGDTIYLTTADSKGNMVSLIQSNFRGMGSGVVVPGLGFGFQDRGQLFSLIPGHANVYAPGKRPFHTIIPGFVTKDGKPWLSFGVMGGGMQPQGHVQILVNLIDFHMNVQEAGDAARWQHFGSSEPTGETMTDGGYVELETGIPWETVRGLKQRGHDIRIGNGAFGGYQGILRDPENGVYHGASESRKDGQAAGF